MPPGFGPQPGFNAMFTIIPMIVIGVFIFVIVKNVATWADNNSKPVEKKQARVASKRSHVWGGGGAGGHVHRAHTSYYVTFEFEDGERTELHVNPKAYGQIAEGDVGTLTYQGSRFHDFERSRW